MRPFPQVLSHRNRLKLAVLTLWLLTLAVYVSLLRYNDLSLKDSVHLISTWLVESHLGPLFFILLYVFGPLLFVPATILSLLGGFLFGPIGILYTIIGSNASAMVAYTIGRFFGKGVLEGNGRSIIRRYAHRMRQNSFQTILIMHLIFLPYELVNYSGGFLQIGWKPFLAGTALGSVVATISVVMLGTSFGTIEELLAGDVTVHPVTLLTSLLLITSSIALSRFLQKRESGREPSG
jgi:uncharacterized membrane protein YdjX (TVP38/TMEM64 family)